MSKPIRVITTKATGRHSKGVDSLGFASTADADKVLGEGAYKVISHTDGSPYEAPKRETKTATTDDKKGGA